MEKKWAYRTLKDVTDALATKQVSAVELVQEIINRVERYDSQVNALCVRDFDKALADARLADSAIARGERKPLLGIPVTVKESINIAGLPTTWGIPEQKDFKPTRDALCVARVKEAGAIILGKTNVPLGLADYETFNEIYGTTNNPYNKAYSAGGSSGGSAAALATGYGPLSLGSDIGGSLRVPAVYCGVYALKPSYGLVPVNGVAPPRLPPDGPARDFAVVGPMARSAADLEALLGVIAGPSEFDIGTAYRLDLPSARHTKLSEHRVLVLDTHPLLPTEEIVRDAIGKFADSLSKKSVTVARQSDLLPDLASTSRTFMRLIMSLFALRWTPEMRSQAATRAAALPADDLSLAAERLRGAAINHHGWLIADSTRAHVRLQWRELFRHFDAVICPVMPTLARPHDHSHDPNTRTIDISGRPYPILDQMAWPAVATLTGLPSAAIPIGLSPQGLPIGVQIIGPWLEDRTPLRLAQLIENEFGGFVPPKGFVD